MIYRLDKFVSESRGVTRTEAKKLLAKGAVAVNGVVIKKGDGKVDTAKDNVTINGRRARTEKFVYIMLNKPAGVVSAAEDKNDVTVVDLVKKDFPNRNLFPAGRLDKTSTGFVLLTDDGEFAHNILSPKRHVDKTYIVTVDSPITGDVTEGFKTGVTLADGEKMLPAEIIPLEDNLKAKIILHQGVYHQIKRMLGVYDIGVNSLHRVKIGGLELDTALVPGEYRKITEEELSKISDYKFTDC